MVPSDLHDLSQRILHSHYHTQLDKTSSPLPPPQEVLHLLTMVGAIVEANVTEEEKEEMSEALAVSSISDMDTRRTQKISFLHSVSITEASLNWVQAARLLARALKFIRLLRLVTYYPSGRPPRLLKIPSFVIQLHQALLQNENWSTHFFATCGAGSRCCVQLLRWLKYVLYIHPRQSEFSSLYVTMFPEWLSSYSTIIFEMRGSQMELFLATEIRNNFQSATVKEKNVNISSVLATQVSVLDSRVLGIEKAIKEVEEKKRNFELKLLNLELEMMQRVEEKIKAFSAKIKDLEAISSELLLLPYKDYHLLNSQNTERSLQLEEKYLLDHLAGLTNQFQINAQLRVRYSNQSIPALLLKRMSEVGMKKGEYLFLQAKYEAMMEASGGEESHLSYDEYRIFEQLMIEIPKVKALLNEVENCLKDEFQGFLDSCMQSLATYQEIRQKEKVFFSVSEREEEEDRAEDSLRANEERVLLTQYIPNELLLQYRVLDSKEKEDSEGIEGITRRRKPLIVILNRDLSEASIDSIHLAFESNFFVILIVSHVTLFCRYVSK